MRSADSFQRSCSFSSIARVAGDMAVEYVLVFGGIFGGVIALLLAILLWRRVRAMRQNVQALEAQVTILHQDVQQTSTTKP